MAAAHVLHPQGACPRALTVERPSELRGRRPDMVYLEQHVLARLGARAAVGRPRRCLARRGALAAPCGLLPQPSEGQRLAGGEPRRRRDMVGAGADAAPKLQQGRAGAEAKERRAGPRLQQQPRKERWLEPGRESAWGLKTAPAERWSVARRRPHVAPRAGPRAGVRHTPRVHVPEHRADARRGHPRDVHLVPRPAPRRHPLHALRRGVGQGLVGLGGDPRGLPAGGTARQRRELSPGTILG
mmetsp:Transcript_40715/g.96823  ORF Transcript_40715/g.96823 Transcript_40715/m.96823 type:complete len:242 (+) Transcript_40715:349-1074(+)